MAATRLGKRRSRPKNSYSRDLSLLNFQVVSETCVEAGLKRAEYNHRGAFGSCQEFDPSRITQNLWTSST